MVAYRYHDEKANKHRRGRFVTPKSRLVEKGLAGEQRSFCFLQRCPLVVYGLALHYEDKLGSIVVGTHRKRYIKHV